MVVRDRASPRSSCRAERWAHAPRRLLRGSGLLCPADTRKDQTTMFSITRNEIDWGGRKLVLETGRVARQADGAVLCTYGDTIVLCTVVGERTPKPGINFF